MKMLLVWLLVAAAAATIPTWLHSQYLLTLVNICGINMMLGLGMLFLFGYAGQLALGQAAFFAVGAYASALLSTTQGVNVWLAIALGAGAAVVVAAVVGAAILRLTGHYFALATLGFGAIVSQIVLNWKEVTRGTDGIVGIPHPSVGGFVLGSPGEMYYVVLGAVLLLYLVARRIRYSRYGRAFLAIRADPLAAEVAGINVFGMKWFVFVLSGFYSGIAGGIYAHMFSFISPDAFGLMVSINILATVLIGGTARIWGVLAGAAAVTGMPELLRFTQQYYMMIYGLGIVGVAVFCPAGISGMADQLWQRWTARPRRAATSDRHLLTSERPRAAQ